MRQQYYLTCCAALLALAAWSSTGWAAAAPLEHRLEARLLPDESAIEVEDVIRLPQGLAEVLELRMARQVEAVQASLRLPVAGGMPVSVPLEVENEAGRLRIALPPEAAGGEVLLRARCVFQEDVEEAPANMDNPGFGVEGVIHPKGAMLLAGSGWHPVSTLPDGDSFTLVLRAPLGLRAVTTGTLVSMADEDGESVSRWTIPPPLGPLPLAAGWWDVQESRAQGVRVLTCLTPENAGLAPRYLDAATRWIAFYERLHGPYPFAQFMVVENFLPTGYGFPGFTLLGGAVLRLPFIPETSLRHEIAHCWWGNGVFVDYSQGNWCEGLTTYVADYLGEEEKSPEAARDYRLRTLRRYAQLAAGQADFPLARFASRMSPASQAVGYGKAMFVFHMIRTRLGDGPFWESLRALYRERLFQEAGWEDLRQAFVTHGGWDEAESRRFLDQWIARPGAPVLALEQMRRQSRDGGRQWRVTGRLSQREPAYRLPLRLKLDLGNAAVRKDVDLADAGQDLEFDVPAAPESVAVDPEADCFRLLAPQEIPATVDTLRGAEKLAVVWAVPQPEHRMEALQTLLAGLAHPRARVVSESSLQEVDLQVLMHRDLLFFGRPTTPLGAQLLGDSAQLRRPAGQEAADVRVLVAGAAEGRGLRAVFDMAEQATDPAVARAAFLLSHYGRYSSLAFREGQNLFKETWPPGDGPATYRFPAD